MGIDTKALAKMVAPHFAKELEAAGLTIVETRRIAELERENQKLALDCLAADGQAHEALMQLAAAQATISRKDEALRAANDCIKLYSHPGSKLVAEALALPAGDRTALDAMLKEAKAEGFNNGIRGAAVACEVGGFKDAADAIRQAAKRKPVVGRVSWIEIDEANK